MSWLLPPLPPTFEAALRDVAGRRYESRLAAAERLGRAEPDERDAALEGLSTLADDAHPSVRATAIAALGLLAAESEIERVIEALADPSPEVREFATVATAQIGGERALSALREALTSDAPEVRFQAVAGVADLSPDDAARDLVPLLADADAEVRGQVIAALSTLDAKHLAGHLAGALEDPVGNVRLEAALGLAALGDHRGEQRLLDALAQRHRIPEIAPALAQLGCTGACDELAKIARSIITAPELRAIAGAALVRLGDERGIAALRRVLRGLRSDARSYAVELARETGASVLTDELVRLSVRPRGVDLLTLVDALATFAPRVEAARLALSRLATRTDEVGQAAKAAVATLESTARPEPSHRARITSDTAP